MILVRESEPKHETLLFSFMKRLIVITENSAILDGVQGWVVMESKDEKQQAEMMTLCDILETAEMSNLKDVHHDASFRITDTTYFSFEKKMDQGGNWIASSYAFPDYATGESISHSGRQAKYDFFGRLFFILGRIDEKSRDSIIENCPNILPFIQFMQ